ncbi:MAG: glutaminyl-peptide cyclotransferase [Candidatus Hydrogenedentota bacterium]
MNYTYTVIAAFPHDTQAFTQGLVIDEGALYEGTGLTGGQSSLRRVDLETGAVEQVVPLPDPGFFGEGITVVGDTIYQLTWRDHTGFVWDKESFELIDQFTYGHEGWGITYDSERLIVSDGTSTIRFYSATPFELLGSVSVREGGSPVNRMNELEYIEGEVYANLWLTDRVVAFDPETGDVTRSIDLSDLLPPEFSVGSGDVLNGIAYGEGLDRLFVTGKRWPLLFEIELEPLPDGTSAF